MGFFKKLFGSPPESAESAEDCFTRGCQHDQRDERDEAIAAFTKAIRLEPHWPLAYNNRGYSYYCKGDCDRAVADYTKAIELDGDCALAYLNRGNAYVDKQMYDRAVTDYTEAIRCDSDNAGGYYMRAHAFYMKKTYPRATADFTEVIRLDPQDEHAWCNRGAAHFQQGQYDEALGDYQEAFRLDPKDPVAIIGKFLAATNARLKAGGEPDGRSAEPTTAPDGGDRPEAENEQEETPPQDERPSPQRVAARAMVLSAVMYRAHMEAYAGMADAEWFHARLLDWIDAVDLLSEFEAGERKFLETPIGWADEKDVMNGCWRSQGLGVLAWALQGFELPRYDQYADMLTAADSVGFMDADAAKRVLNSAELRGASEVDDFAAHITIVDWRLVQFCQSPEHMDFVAYLKAHPFSREIWLDGLAFIRGDMAIGGECIADASENEFADCRSIVVERHVAAYWLQGNHATYSQVSPDTILSGR